MSQACQKWGFLKTQSSSHLWLTPQSLWTSLRSRRVNHKLTYLSNQSHSLFNQEQSLYPKPITTPYPQNPSQSLRTTYNSLRNRSISSRLRSAKARSLPLKRIFCLKCQSAQASRKTTFRLSYHMTKKMLKSTNLMFNLKTISLQSKSSKSWGK